MFPMINLNGFYVVEKHVGCEIINHGGYEWYISDLFNFHELIRYSHHNDFVGGFAKSSIWWKSFVLNTPTVKVHIKPHEGLSMFMLKFGGIIEKSPNFMYKIIED